MSDFYTAAQRSLQDEFDSRALADRLADAIVTDELTGPQVEFIAAQDLLFLATVDEAGFPSCSYKGGARGFARVVDPGTLIFPIYDGNGMFMSLGNIEDQHKVGLLFIDFERPQRLRLRGNARVLRDGPMVESYPGAIGAVQVAVEKVWQNCPRYVHPMQRLEASPHVPAADGAVKFALWKRIDAIQDVLPEADRAEAEALGLIDVESYEAMVKSGEPG